MRNCRLPQDDGRRPQGRSLIVKRKQFKIADSNEPAFLFIWIYSPECCENLGADKAQQCVVGFYSILLSGGAACGCDIRKVADFGAVPGYNCGIVVCSYTRSACDGAVGLGCLRDLHHHGGAGRNKHVVWQRGSVGFPVCVVSVYVAHGQHHVHGLWVKHCSPFAHAFPRLRECCRIFRCQKRYQRWMSSYSL